MNAESRQFDIVSLSKGGVLGSESKSIGKERRGLE